MKYGKERKPSIPVITRIDKSKIEIESGIPIPEEVRQVRSVYPFEKLEPGQSFSFPTLHKADHIKRQLSSVVLSSRSYIRKYNPNANFVARIDGALIRVWRTEDKKPN